MAVVRASVALTTVVCVERLLLARVQLGEPRLGGLCLGRTGVRSSSSALAARVATTGWRRSSRWRGRQHTRRVRRRAGRPNQAPVCRRVRAQAPTPELLGVQHILPRPRPLGPARSLGLVARAGAVGARAERRQARACTPPPRAPSPCRARASWLPGRRSVKFRSGGEVAEQVPDSSHRAFINSTANQYTPAQDNPGTLQKLSDAACSPLAGEACSLPRTGSVSPSRAMSQGRCAIRDGR